MKRSLLLFASILTGWGVVELGGQALLGLAPNVDERIALYTSPNWAARGSGLRWAPDTHVRTVGVYGDRIEYDVRFETNDLGYIDHRDYGTPTDVPVEHRWAFVGDSFTAGYYGGEPWVPALRDAANQQAEPVEIYNLGVSGAGVVQFIPNLNGADRDLDFGNVVFLIISNDFERKAWRPVEIDERIILCPADIDERRCAAADSRILVLRDPDESASQIIARLGGEGWIASGAMAWLERRSLVAAAVFGASVPAAAQVTSVDLTSWLALLERRHGERRIFVLQIPEKAETRRGALRIEIGEQIRAAGHDYVSLLDECELRPAHYFRRDPHLRAEGNEELRRCVGRVLGLLQ